MKRRRSNSSSSSSGGNDAAPGSLQPQSCRPDFGELLHLLGTAAEGNRSGLFVQWSIHLTATQAVGTSNAPLTTHVSTAGLRAFSMLWGWNVGGLPMLVWVCLSHRGRNHSEWWFYAAEARIVGFSFGFHRYLPPLVLSRGVPQAIYQGQASAVMSLFISRPRIPTMRRRP